MEFTDKIAVVTGGASGMGLSIAQRMAALGAKVVIADIEEAAITAAVVDINNSGGSALGVPTDVSSVDAMNNLRDVTEKELGAVDLLFLNAGVGSGGKMHEMATADWEWVLGVNLWGVIHGITAFLPGMVERNSGHVVSTASVAGLVSFPGMGNYNATKHAVVTMMETLHHEQVEAQSNIGVSVLCPGFVKTRIFESERNRPEQLQDPIIPTDEDQPDMSEAVAAIYEQALDPDAVALMVEEAMRNKQFWILTDEVFVPAIALRHRNIEQQHNPQLRGHIWEEQLGLASEPTD